MAEESLPHWKDYYLVLCFAFAFPVIRLLLDGYVYQRLAKRLVLSAHVAPDAAAGGRKVSKATESMWKLTYYLAYELFALVVTCREPWFGNSIAYWDGWPNQTMKFQLKLFYTSQCGFYVYSVVALLVWETRRKDFGVMMSHHLVTIALVSTSFITGCFRAGSLVLALHDASDVLLELAKLLKYSGSELGASLAFACFALSWLGLRLVYFPMWIIWSTSYQCMWYVDFRQPQMVRLYYYFNTLLMSLLMIHVYWWVLICRMMLRQLQNKGKVGEDVRSGKNARARHQGEALKQVLGGTQTPKRRTSAGIEQGIAFLLFRNRALKYCRVAHRSAPMSKKKVMPRSTMTLKDFHGGSIPSDLQLPSAPGMTVAPYERQANTWGASRAYATDRRRSRTLEDRASYFPNPANIGRNYDEDERRPHSSCGRPSSLDANPEVARAQLASNAWVTRREADHGRLAEPDATGSPVRARNSLARIQEASAIDKVSSGRWQPDHARQSSVTGKPDERSTGKECLPQDRHTSNGGGAENPDTRPWIADDSLPLKTDPAVGSYNEDQATVDCKTTVAAASRSDGGDRPRLKLLPRSRPADSQAEQRSDVDLEAAGMTKSEPEREAATALPRLNLKPRSQITVDKERQSPYGGARPRELVLRERGADEVALTAEPSSHAALRGTERKYRDAKLSLISRWDQEGEAQDGGRRDIESWRRPEEASTIKHGLAASALELALSFSRASSISSPQDSLESCFSRLTNTPSPAARYASSRGVREVRRSSVRDGY